MNIFYYIIYVMNLCKDANIASSHVFLMDKIMFMIDIKDDDLKIIKQMMINIIGQDSSYL